jgi:hypothetical protein
MEKAETQVNENALGVCGFRKVWLTRKMEIGPEPPSGGAQCARAQVYARK